MRAAAALAVCAGLCACGSSSGERTQVMVLVDAESGVRALTEEVDIEVRTGSGAVADWEVRLDQNITPGAGVDWPLEIALVPRDGDADRVYLAVATARGEGGEAVAEVRAISGYQRGKTLSLLLLFEDACLDRASACDDEQTCRSGDCVDAHVEPGELPDYERDEDGAPVLKPFWDVDAGRDAGGDAGGGDDAGSDAGTDGGPTTVGNECEQHADCNDRMPCNGLERCVRDRCQAGTPFECPELDDPCQENVCVDDGGNPGCQAQNAREGESCQAADESGDPQASCARDYVCADGACEPQTVEECSQPSQCGTLAGCDPEDGCIVTPLPDTTDCDDGDPCTQDDQCSGTDATCAGLPYSCDDSVLCTVDTCDGAGGCTRVATDALCSGPCKGGTCDATAGCLNVTLATDFTDCEDSDPATSGDLCYRGECAGGTERAPTASCEVAGCGCTAFGTVRDLDFFNGTYVGMIEAGQNGEAPCATGTVSIVYDVAPDALTAYATDTANGAIAESSSDLSVGFAVSNTHVGTITTASRTVDWLATPIADAIAAQTPSITSFRGVARHFEGSIVGGRESHLWIWGSDAMTTTSSRVVRCSSCAGAVIGCDPALVCSYGTGFAASSIGAVGPYTNAAMNTGYGGVLQLVNMSSGSVRKRIYEDGSDAAKDYQATAIESEDPDGAWNGTLRLAGAGQVLVYGSGTNNLRLCTDATYTGNTSCVPITGLPNQSVRNYTRAAMGTMNSAVFMLANTGAAYYLLLLPTGVDPAVGSNWREILLANSGTTVANGVAASGADFMVLGRNVNGPYVWSWGP